MKTETYIALKTGADLQQSIAEHPFFRGFHPERLSDIVRTAREVAFTEGQVLFRETEPASRFFLITEGEVALESRIAPDRALVIQTIGPGDVLGWSWLVAPYQWHFTARAVTPAKAISIDAAHLLVACEKDPASAMISSSAFSRLSSNDYKPRASASLTSRLGSESALMLTAGVLAAALRLKRTDSMPYQISPGS